MHVETTPGKFVKLLRDIADSIERKLLIGIRYARVV